MSHEAEVLAHREPVQDSKSDASTLLALHQPDALYPPCYIARLPVELLAEIFCYIPFLSIDPLERDPRVFMHVCRHWRQTALACKRCWTVLPLCDAGWTELAVERSYPSLLIIRASSYPKRSGTDNTLAVALGDLSRVQHIILDRSDEGDSQAPYNAHYLLLGLQALPALNLETLCIGVNEDDEIQFASQFLQGRPGKLRLLSLLNITPRSNGPVLFGTSLTSLSLRGVFGIPTEVTFVSNELAEGRTTALWTPVWSDWRTFQQCLDSMPSLESLDLGDLLLPHEEDALPLRKAVLPALQTLDVADRLSRLRTLLMVMSFPPHTDIHITCETMHAEHWHAQHTGFFSAAVDSYFSALKAHSPTFDWVSIVTPPSSDGYHEVEITLADSSTEGGTFFTIYLLHDLSDLHPIVCLDFALGMLSSSSFVTCGIRNLILDIDTTYPDRPRRTGNDLDYFLRLANRAISIDVRSDFGMALLVEAVQFYRILGNPRGMLPNLQSLFIPPPNEAQFLAMSAVLAVQRRVDLMGPGLDVNSWRDPKLYVAVCTEFARRLGTEDVRWYAREDRVINT
ncbi:hypothetical protein BV25DRAFT_1417866 [Artomyces pyxidatus]|uniref:Uncharacterized protein n=1 Tax=Artomyces pyxidatus TaxID=48021 RepID=A0ACB8TE36_9AGAM|nr:hypothetical protein BV25DRAFT_1417866 [Artomyces pyxidatus]